MRKEQDKEVLEVVQKSTPGKPLYQTLGLTKETLLDWYSKMLLIRRFEEKAAQLYGMGKIAGFCHLYIGQEAVGMGTIAALRPGDYVFTSYRDHGLAILRGADPKAAMAELMGKQTGLVKGKGGSMHFFDPLHNFMGGYGIVGGHVPLAAGVAFASKYRKEPHVTLCYMGEGATNQGVFFETLNLAALWKLPIVLICENNRYGMGTPLERASSIAEIYKKGSAFGIPGAAVDGMNVYDVYEATKTAVGIAREKSQPFFLEARTYRYRGHSMSDPVHGHYRTKEEVEEQKKRDPIFTYSEHLKEWGFITQERIERMDEEIKAQIDEAVAFAENSPPPAPQALWEDVYSE